MKAQKILISGAGIAGPTLAFWLHKQGHQVTIIEKAPQLRLGGQNIDISDAAIDIVKLMGIEKEILKHNTTEVGLQIVNEKNEVQAAFPKESPLAFTSKYEILRGDLAEILVNLTKSVVTYRFGENIEGLTQHPDQVEVVFKNKSKEKFDLVIAADGVSSTTRKLILGINDPYKYLGVYTSYATVPRRETDTKWARWYNAPKGRVLLLRPDNKGTTRASVNFWFNGPAEPHYSNDEAIAQVQSVLEGAGWEAPRLAKDIVNDKDLYLGPVSQVRLPTWSKNRCCLVGDAAYCPTPFTGMGTTLAIIGAYVLADELAHHDDHASAFNAYEKRLRPFVEDIQKFIPGQFRLVYPQSKTGVIVFNKLLSVFGSQTMQKMAGLFKKTPAEAERKFSIKRLS